MQNNAAAITKVLEQAGVTHVFGVAGTSILQLIESIGTSPKITFIGARDEVNAVHMADGYARASGTLGVCVVHVGPGALRSAYGLGTAHKDGTPLLLITGNEVSDSLNPIAYHVIDIQRILGAITKGSFLVRPGDNAATTVTRAIISALSGRPGPVHLDLPKDLSEAPIVADAGAQTRLPWNSRGAATPWSIVRPSREDIEGVLEILRTASLPVFLAGGGVHWSGAAVPLRKIAEDLRIPIVCTDGGRGSIPEDHPLFAGVVGRQAGDRCASDIVGQADVVIAMGVSFSDVSTHEWSVLSPQTRLVRVDIDPERATTGYVPNLPITSDVGAFIKELNDLSMGTGFDWKWDIELLREALDEERDSYLSEIAGGKEGVDPWRVVSFLSEALPRESLISVDSGLHSFFGKKLRVLRERSYLRSAGFGAMGYSLPALVGATLFQRVPAVGIMGDGCFVLCMSDLETVARLDVPVLAVVLNDARFGSQFYHQEHKFNSAGIGTQFSPLALSEIARVAGVAGYEILRSEDIADVLGGALASNKPAVVDVKLAPEARPPRWIEGSGDSRTRQTL